MGVTHRSRTGQNTWYTLAVVSFDMMFTYLNVGWEGSAYDIAVLQDSMFQPKFNFPHPL